MKNSILNVIKCAALIVPAVLLSGCNGSSQADDDAPEAVNGAPIYLRGDMNDYGVSGNFRLRKNEAGLCTEAALRAEWSPYHFKFADEKWSKGTNFGYMDPPGTIHDGQGPVMLNPNSKFEDLTLDVDKDGIYRFCLLKQNDSYFVGVMFVREVDEKSLSETSSK